MPSVLLRIPLATFILFIILRRSVGQLPEQWCIADEQTTDEVLQSALDWACGKGGADCSKIQVHQPCYFPNTVRDHASYAFNSYWQRLKHKGGSCYFNGAAFVTEVDPSPEGLEACGLKSFTCPKRNAKTSSHNSCKFEYLP